MKNYLILLAVSISLSAASDHRVKIDKKERAEVVKNILNGNIELLGDSNVQLYGVSDFYLLLDRVVAFPENDENRKLSDVAKTFEDGSKVKPNADFLSKKSEYFASLSLIHYIDNNKDAESAKELLTFFDTLIEMSRHDDGALSDNARRILISYSPYVKEKLDYKWFKDSFYTQTEAGKLLAKYRK